MAIYKIKVGGHTDENGSYHANDPNRKYIKTDLDLVAKFGSDKFEKVERVELPEVEAGQATTKDQQVIHADLEAMTVAELRKMADSEGIELNPSDNKAAIIGKIAAAYV